MHTYHWRLNLVFSSLQSSNWDFQSFSAGLGNKRKYWWEKPVDRIIKPGWRSGSPGFLDAWTAVVNRQKRRGTDLWPSCAFMFGACQWSYCNEINVITHFTHPQYVSTSSRSLPISHLSSPHLSLLHPCSTCPLYRNKQRPSSEAGRSLQGRGEVSGKWRKPCHVCHQRTVHSCSTMTLCLVLELLFITCLLPCTQGYGSGGALFQLSILHSTQGTQNLAQFSESHVSKFHHLQY